MLNVVFSNSLQGALRICACGDVVGIGFHLDIGNIQGKIDGVERKKVFDDIWGHASFDKKEKDQFFQKQCMDYQKLQTAAKQKEPLCIWVDASPNSLCGCYFVCHCLADIECPIAIVEMPRFLPVNNQTMVNYRTWDEVSVSELSHWLSLKRDLSSLEKAYMANHWQQLMEENASLRAVVNHRLCSVPACFYDYFIETLIPEQNFVMAELIGWVLGIYEFGISDGFIAGRIQVMIQQGILHVVEETSKDYPYGSILKRTK